MTIYARILAYIRVSTEEQAVEGQSLGAQEDRIRGYCQAHGLELMEILREEGVSAKVPLYLRPQGARLMKAMKKHKAGHIVVLKLDRLFRSTVDALRTVEKWDKVDIGLHIVDMGGQSLSTKSAIGKLFLTMLAGVAEFERQVISERTRQAMAYKRKNGEFVGNVPLGFDCADGKLLPNETELNHVRLIFMQRASGITLQAIADNLMRQGILPKRGGSHWYPSTIKSILDNADLYNLTENGEQGMLDLLQDQMQKATT